MMASAHPWKVVRTPSMAARRLGMSRVLKPFQCSRPVGSASISLEKDPHLVHLDPHPNFTSPGAPLPRQPDATTSATGRPDGRAGRAPRTGRAGRAGGPREIVCPPLPRPVGPKTIPQESGEAW